MGRKAKNRVTDEDSTPENKTKSELKAEIHTKFTEYLEEKQLEQELAYIEGWPEYVQANKKVVGRVGFEPTTNGLKVHCSTS